jgi:phosphoesterase RecJ-like protein
MGKSVVMYNRDGVPYNLGFLKGSEKVATKLSGNEKFDLAIMVDCAQRDRISEDFEKHKGISSYICIDHHELDVADADFLLVDKNAASTGEVVLHVIENMGVAIDQQIAECIYTTLVVDTGFFKYSNTSAHALEIASGLVKKGASPWRVAMHLDESNPEATYRLLALSLSTLDLKCEGKYASMEITEEMLKKSGAKMEYSEEFATYPRSIAGVEVSALFREVENERVKVSLRSKNYVDVAKISKKFDGGGHCRAAGFRMKAGLSEAKKIVFEAVKGEF